MALYKWQYDKALTLRKINEYASVERASLEFFSHFHILKCYFLHYSVGTSDTSSQKTYIFSGLKLHLHTYTIWMQFLVITYSKGIIYKRQYTDKTLTSRNAMYMRASGASELRKFSHFYILKLLFLSIFCRYFRYFVGTNDMLVGLHVPTNFQMYRQNSEKHYGGGGGGGNCSLGPPPPSGYANECHLIFLTIHENTCIRFRNH